MFTPSCLPHMAEKGSSKILALAVQILTFSVLASGLAHAQNAQLVVGYYQESSAFPLSNLVSNGSLARLTHLNYAFARIIATGAVPNDTYTCAAGDPAGETGPNGVFQQILALKRQNPNLKVLISVGGASGSGSFTRAADPTRRAQFVQSCIDQFIDGQVVTPKIPGLFDGVDVDWEFPFQATEAANYNLLLSEFRAKLDGYKLAHPGVQRLLLTSAVGPHNGPETDLQNIQFSGSSGATNFVDFFNVMSYDYAGNWNAAASSTAPLTPITQHISDLMARFGVPANKMVLGIPFYGVHYAGNFAGDSVGTSLSVLLSQSSKAPVVIPGTQDAQSINYSDLVKNTLTGPNGATNQNVGVSHDIDSSAWAFDSANSLLWSYDDEITIARKAAYARTQGLAGIMTWDISKDTVAGTLLCAMETGASGSSTPVCGSAPGNTSGTLLFDFEGEGNDQGWKRTGGVFSAFSSPDKAYTGASSLVASFITYHQLTFQPQGTVYVTPPALVQPGSTVDFHVWMPSGAFTNLNDIRPFFMDSNWTWTSTSVDMSKLTPNSWNTLSVHVPATAVLPFNQIGIQFDSKNLWNGRIYIDSVTVR